MTTPNMNMDLPEVGVTVDPTWATKLIIALGDVLDAHDHSAGKGIPVPTDGILIDNDLTLNHYNLLEVKAVNLDNQISSPPLALENANGLLLRYGDDLWWQVDASTAVQITVGGNLNNDAIATNVWNQVFIDLSDSIDSAATFTYIGVDTTSGEVDIDLPAASSVTGGRYYVVKDVGGAASTNNIVVTPDGTDTIDGVATTRSITLAYGSFIIVSNGIDGWNIFRDGHVAATFTQLGVIKLAGDLSGPGSTADTPKVLLATDAQAGLIQLASDLAGTYDAPVIVSLTGVAGACTVTPATDLVVPSTASETFESGSTLNIESGATVTIDPAVVVSLTDAVLTTPAVSGGTVDSAAITGGTIDTAAITPGSLDLAAVTFTRRARAVLSLVDVQDTKLASDFTTNSSSYVDLTGLVCSLTCVAGDILIINASIYASSGTTGVGGFARVMMNDGGGDIDPKQYMCAAIEADAAESGAANDHYGATHFKYEVVNTGTVTARIQGTGAAGIWSATYQGGSTSTTHVCQIMVQQFTT